MLTIDRVELHIGEHSGTAFIEVTWGASVTAANAAEHPMYRETLLLIGDDEGLGEDGRSEPIPGGVISDRIRFFSPSQPSFAATKQLQLPVGALNEDGLFRASEIKARLTMVPLPPQTMVAESNVVRRSAPIIQPIPA